MNRAYNKKCDTNTKLETRGENTSLLARKNFNDNTCLA